MPEKTVQKEPGKKPAPSKKPKPQQEVVVQIPLSELHPFPDHPFQVREDASILAITVCQADWDRRYSPDNRAWANAMSIPTTASISSSTT